MKSFIAVLVIFALLLVLIVSNAIYVRRIFSEISELASQVEESDDIREIPNIWSKSQRILSFSIEADEIERMNDLMESLRTSIAADNPYDISKYCRLIKELAEELIEYERISLDSIF